jgi:hypothetical protein
VLLSHSTAVYVCSCEYKNVRICKYKSPRGSFSILTQRLSECYSSIKRVSWCAKPRLFHNLILNISVTSLFDVMTASDVSCANIIMILISSSIIGSQVLRDAANAPVLSGHGLTAHTLSSILEISRLLSMFTLPNADSCEETVHN